MTKFQPFQVLHLHVVLGLQDLLRLRLHAARLCHLGHRHCLRYHRLHIFFAQRRGLQMVCCLFRELR